MKIGIPKEMKDDETRVAILPCGVDVLTKNSHQVFVQKDAGLLSGYSNEEYEKSGATIVDDIETVYKEGDFIVKVKEPQRVEYDLLRKEQILFAFLHLVVEKELTKIFLKKRINTFACENIMLSDGTLPVLLPMSDIAGKSAVLIGANLLANYNKGEGILLSSIAGIKQPKVVILGCGSVGSSAIKTAFALGCRVVALDVDMKKLAKINNFNNSIETLFSTPQTLQEALLDADLIICSVLSNGERSPVLISEETVKRLKKGSVIIDISVDQGSIVETIDKTTTHTNPVFEKHGVIHYAVTNIPSAFGKTATIAFANCAFKYIEAIANLGFIDACKVLPELQNAVSTCYGRLTNHAVSKALNEDFYELSSIIGF